MTCWSCQINVPIWSSHSLKTHRQFAPCCMELCHSWQTACIWAICITLAVVNQGWGHSTSTARQCLLFNASLIRTYPKWSVGLPLDKVHICSIEFFILLGKSQVSAQFLHIHPCPKPGQSAQDAVHLWKQSSSGRHTVWCRTHPPSWRGCVHRFRRCRHDVHQRPRSWLPCRGRVSDI